MTDRIEADAYMTPPGLAEAICDRLAKSVSPSAKVLEPSAGTGNFLRAAQRLWPSAVGLELDPERAAQSGSHCLDSLTLPPSQAFDLVIGNPPFSLAAEFVRWAHGQLTPVGQVAFLLKLSFLSGKKRVAKLYSDFPLAELHPIVGRAKFRGDMNSTDNQEYGLFVWRPGAPGTLKPHIHWKAQDED